MTKVVALIATVVTTAVELQVSTYVSMLAAVVLERKGVHLLHAAQLSAMRYSNGGILSLWISMARIARLRPSLLVVIATVLLVIFYAFQLMSFALLSDVKREVILGFPNNTTDAYNFSTALNEAHSVKLERSDYADFNMDLTAMDFALQDNPGVYPVFAEYSEPPNTDSGNNNLIQDTGKLPCSFKTRINDSRRWFSLCQDMLLTVHFAGSTKAHYLQQLCAAATAIRLVPAILDTC